MSNKECERARRQEGFPASFLCQTCGRGPCHVNAYRTEAEMTAATGVRFGLPRDFYWTNRLHGAAINERGEAI